ncbi:phosphatase PAP2 family protein [Leuconostoc sp. MS02]|uniref:Phosphatase PAP2 family protein n=1 Tax=Leuconostoc aquikimchii TaxID=3236804 RepID=A0ABV3S4P2_9LACO
MIISITNKQSRQAIISGIVAIVLAVLIKFHVIFPTIIDNIIHSWFTNIQTGYGDVVMAIATFVGNPVVDVVYILILAGVLIIAKLHIPAIWIVATILSGDIFLAIVRAIVGRTRPVGHLLSDSSSSFPSPHVFGLFIVIFIIAILVTPNINSTYTQILINWISIIIGLMTILSRIYFNAHFLSDTVAAVLFAYSWVILSAALYPKLAVFLQNHIAIFKHDEI